MIDEPIKALARTRQIGGSLVVTIPAEIVRTQQIRENEVVELEVKKRKKNYFGALKGIGSFTKKDRMQDRE